ncbi:peroxynitrite isomerase THAP4-like isoform X1 [Ornithodoros turicata]|uniref:peroxynitrite isomerase THAP4-like isoform X1 n=1 Tax=Ornithodoros turicata TaxID=34597 RepID=UPI0031393BBC
MGCCSAVACANSDRKGFRMFRFPSDSHRRRLWLAKTKRGGDWEPTVKSQLCEAHFEDSQFEQHRADGWKKLKPNAVPTLFTHTKAKAKRRPQKKKKSPPSANVHDTLLPEGAPHKDVLGLEYQPSDAALIASLTRESSPGFPTVLDSQNEAKTTWSLAPADPAPACRR